MGKIIFTSYCLYESKHLSACVQLCENLCIDYLEAQTQMVRCPTAFQEMKCIFMLNTAGVLSLHSYNFIAVCHSKLLGSVSPSLLGIQGRERPHRYKHDPHKKIFFLDPNDSHVLCSKALTLSCSSSLTVFSLQKNSYTILFLIRLFRRMVAPVVKMIKCSTNFFI